MWSFDSKERKPYLKTHQVNQNVYPVFNKVNYSSNIVTRKSLHIDATVEYTAFSKVLVTYMYILFCIETFLNAVAYHNHHSRPMKDEKSNAP